MSEYRTTEIQTMPKYERKGFQQFSLDFRYLGFWNYNPTANCLKSELTTPTIIQNLNANINAPQGMEGWGL